MLFQPPLVELDEVEVSADIFPAGAAGLLQEVNEARFFTAVLGCREIIA